MPNTVLEWDKGVKAINMRAVKVLKRDAEKARKRLFEQGLLDFDYEAVSDKSHVYFPLKKSVPSAVKEISGKERILKEGIVGIVEKRLPRNEHKRQLKSALDSELSEEEALLVNRSYDIIGNIAILDLPPGLKMREKKIAQTLMALNKNIRTVLNKSGIHSGEFRTQRLRYIAGEKTKETLYKENNAQLLLDVEKVYFSPRLSTERKRIAGLVRPGERVLVMFSGCGPYPMVISKNTLAKEVVGIEKNRVAHEYALKNAKLNKAGNVRLYCGDVRKIVPKLRQKFDRILMPLPKDADSFLDVALRASKKGTIIHLYLFLDKEELDDSGGRKKLGQLAARYRKRLAFLGMVRCGQYSPSTFRACLDFQIL